jgi:hypothetical protein
MLVFSTQLCKPLCIHVYSVWGEGAYGALGLRQISTCRKVPLQVNFIFLSAGCSLVRAEVSPVAKTSFMEDYG